MNAIRNMFYLTSAWGSGMCLILMTLLILAQIIARFMGVVIPSSEDFAGWLLSATLFFGLAYTFNAGGHIRVTIMLMRLPKGVRKFFESINMIVGILIVAFLAYYTVFTVYESYDYGDVTDTYLVVPLWAVQLPMAIGSVCLFIAFVDSSIQMLLGKTPGYIQNEDELTKEE